ncbi:MAG TPA: MFS transporter [Caulobacteraceae bacterium]|nr:MFS transporter [Caulobacteraceae bacterium]
MAVAASQAAPRAPRPAALGFIYVAVMMNVVTMGVTAPVFPVLVKTLGHVGDAGAARISGVFGAAWAVMQFFFAPIFGSLSDRFGRRPVLLVSMFGLALDYVIMALAPSIPWLFVGRIISGITSASSSAAGAYVADVSNDANRARNFGRFQAAANAGIVLGPVLGGFLGDLDPRAPFWVAAGLAIANGLYGLFVVPESLPQDRRMPFHWTRANPVGAFRLLGRPALIGLAFLPFLTQFAGMSFNSVFQFYTHYRFGWGPKDVGLLLIVLGGGNIVVQSLLSGAAARRIGERGAVLVGFALSAAGFAFMGLAPTRPLFWTGLVFCIFGGIAFANVQSLMTSRVGVDEQGQLQGALTIFLGITGFVGPLLFTNAFAWSIGPGRWLGLPGLAILLGALMIATAFVIAVFVARPPRGAPAPA